MRDYNVVGFRCALPNGRTKGERSGLESPLTRKVNAKLMLMVWRETELTKQHKKGEYDDNAIC